MQIVATSNIVSFQTAEIHSNPALFGYLKITTGIIIAGSCIFVTFVAMCKQQFNDVSRYLELDDPHIL